MARKIYSEEELQKRIESLPEAAADFLYSADMAAAVKQIADKHHLHIDQMSLLEAETGELMLGLTETQEFVPNLVDTLHVNTPEAEAIAKEINEEIMLKVRGMMGSPAASSASVQTPAAPLAPKPASAPGIAPMPVSTPTVAMPSAASAPRPEPAPKAAGPSAPATPVFASAPASAPAAAPTPKPAAPSADLVAAEAMLSERKAAAPAPAPKTDPNKPQNYKADPYREAVE